MALPTLEKTWQFDVNQAVSQVAADDTNRDILYAIKASLIGFASNAWDLTSSSDGTTADLTDNWASYTDLVFASGSTAHSWAVLTNTVSGAQLCIDCNVASTATETCPIYYSPGGGYATTGLVTTARPTAPSDEIRIDANPGWGGYDTAWSAKLHVLHSTDGTCSRVVICYNGDCRGLWVLDAVKSPVSGWTDSNVGVAKGQSTLTAEYLTYAIWNDAANILGYGTTSFSLYLTSEGYGSAAIGENITVADGQSGGWPMCPAGLASETVNHVGRKGALFDLYWGSTTRITGDTYPSDGSYQFTQFGDMIVPWNGTLPQVS